MLALPGEQSAVALGTVGDRQRADLAAAIIEQSGRVGVLVNVDADDHRDLLTSD